MRRGARRAGILTCGATLVAAGLVAPVLTQSAGASVPAANVAPRSLADDTVLGAFSPLGTGVPGYQVLGLAMSGDDTLYVGGDFNAAGGVPGADGIAVWSNADDAWHALGAGVAGVVYPIALSRDDTVYAGGLFTSASGVPGTRKVAAWSNADDMWHALGVGLYEDVHALAVSEDDTVYAGGIFTDDTGVPGTDKIAAWSNADDTWHPLGVGLTTSSMFTGVEAIALQGDDTVYVGGGFSDASGVPGTDKIAAWSNADDTWHPLGVGVVNVVNAIAVSGDDTVYVGGAFSDASGVPGTIRIAAWSNADDTWHALGSEVDDEVMALAVDDARGLVYAGGYFTHAGTTDDSRVAVWDVGLGEWIALQAAGGEGVSGGVRALALDDSVLYLGGYFAKAGGLTVNGIARWTWDAPSAEAVPATGGNATTIQVRGSGLIGVTGVRVNGSPAAYTRDDSTTVSVTIPGSLYDGTYSVAVDAVGGTATTNYTVTGAPRPSPSNPPGAPTGVAAVAGDAAASVSWVAPVDSGSFAVSSYEVVSSPGGKGCLVSAPSLTCEVAGLTNGTSYTFTVRALNGAGWGGWSTPSAAVTPQAPLTKSIVITGSRDTSDSRYVRVSGRTTDLVGEQVAPWVRFPGESSYSAGTGLKTVDAAGRFDWSRRTGKKVYVYFTHGSVKSNTVTIPAR